MNMFKPTKAKTVAEYIEAVPTERKDTILQLHNFIRKTVPRLKPHFAYNMLGYGSFPYKNSKKEILSWPTIALANQKNVLEKVESVNKTTGDLIAGTAEIVSSGEMADADFGYVGGAPGKINLYVGKECVKKNIPFAAADETLIALIKEHGRWQDPS